jgi:hypothetical protein
MAWAYTLGTMYFPRDESKAERFGDGMAASFTLRSMADDRAMRTECKPQHFSDIVGRADQFQPALGEAMKSHRPAQLAAGVLWTSLRFGAHLPELKGLNKAVKIVCRARSCSRTEVMEAWGGFKAVAHLWAVFSPDSADPPDERSLLLFLSEAEWLRRKAELQLARGAREPLLAADIAFTPPANLKIEPAPLAIPAPEEWMVKELCGAQLVQVHAD